MYYFNINSSYSMVLFDLILGVTSINNLI